MDTHYHSSSEICCQSTVPTLTESFTSRTLSKSSGRNSMMLNKRSGIVAFSLPVALLILIQALVAFPTRVAAQCPTMDPEGATFGSTNFNTVKSQMWYNDGIWWGVFSDDFTGIHFYSFPNNAATQGPIIDASITGIP